jgi:hypothetical protein
MSTASYKIALCALLEAVFALSLASCGSDKSAAGTMNTGRSSVSLAGEDDPETAALARAAFGEEQPPSSGRSGSGSRAASTQVKAAAPMSAWSLVLGTFSGEGHELSAATMIANLRNLAPQTAPELAYARVHSTAKGSLVVYGNYTGRDDPRARTDQDRLKAVQYQGRPLFNRVILTHIDLRAGQSNLHPHDLLLARRAHPNVVPMYTIDVALWDDFDSGKLTWDDIRHSAEMYCQKLRAQGFEAYFYHNPEHQRSIVTVGLFDQRAINPKSGMFSEEVELVMRKFPARLVNGEPLLEVTDPYQWRPADKSKRQPLATKPQTPKLVLVPEL